MRVRLMLVATVLVAPIASAQQVPTEVVDAFHQALAGQDQAAVEGFLAPEVVVYEHGLVEKTLAAYSAGSLNTHMALARGTTWTVETRRMGGTGDHRWVISTYRVNGTGDGGQAIDSTYLETMFLDRTDGEFRISHIHWSQPSPTPTVPPA